MKNYNNWEFVNHIFIGNNSGPCTVSRRLDCDRVQVLCACDCLISQKGPLSSLRKQKIGVSTTLGRITEKPKVGSADGHAGEGKGKSSLLVRAQQTVTLLTSMHLGL